MNKDNLINSMHDDIINDLKRFNAIYDRNRNIFEYILPTESINDKDILEIKNAVYELPIEEIDKTLEKTFNLYKNIEKLHNMGINISNMANKLVVNDYRRELQELNNKELTNVFETYFVTAPKNVTVVSCWNTLIVNGLLDEKCNNRVKDYGTHYLRINRLARLVELDAPNTIIKNELRLITNATLNKENFKEFDNKTISYNNEQYENDNNQIMEL